MNNGKRVGPAISGWEAFREVFALYGTTKARLEALEAKRDAEIAATKARYEQLTSMDSASLAVLEGDLKEFLQANKSSFGEERNRFKDLSGGRVGFRRGKEVLAPIAGKTWEAVLEAAKGARRRFGAYLEIVEQLDKRKLEEAPVDVLAELGLSRTQKDEPFLDVRNVGRISSADAGVGVPA